MVFLDNVYCIDLCGAVLSSEICHCSLLESAPKPPLKLNSFIVSYDGDTCVSVFARQTTTSDDDNSVRSEATGPRRRVDVGAWEEILPDFPQM